MASPNVPVTSVDPHSALPAEGGPLAAEDSLVAEELLVEEISIDGMCGVY